ncbi:MAG TPA: GNAT family N-acetyltransferase [Steroidobacteraceae bacterium]|jgi:ribosomal-protein-alanine N-acetyltransferase|nr:GNAT family N-acetyltransferase [Steroidobacteraceae bacterium]
MVSERLRYRAVKLADLDEFHRLVQDPYVRRYLMDGNLYPREWSEERVLESDELFERRGVGIWMVSDIATNELVGFCGFLEILRIHPEPQIVYAMFERFSGCGYATEMARTSIAHARQSGFADIIASVDEINAASLHILQKLGFERVTTQQGSFGNMHVLRLPG